MVFFFIVFLAVIFRISYLFQYDIYNSDHAFIGLQAIRQLHGEWFWSLWGSTYQGPFEAWVTSAFIPIFGVNNFSLWLTPMTGFFCSLWFCFKIFNENTTKLKSFLLTLFLVIGARIYMHQQVIPYRQWTIFFILLALYYALRKKTLTKMQSFLMGVSPFFGYYTDNFVIQFLPAVLLCSYLRNYYREKTLFLYLGSFLGVIFLVLVSKLMPEGMGAPISFSWKFPNALLFFKECLPEIIGLKLIDPLPAFLQYFFILLHAGSLLIVLYFIYLSFKSFFKERILSFELKLSFLFGVVTVAACSVGFMGKHLLMDQHAVRYLTPLIYSIPFLLLPYFSVTNSRLFLLPSLYFLNFLICSFIQVLSIRVPLQERAPANYFFYSMKSFLEKKNIACGYSNYWIAYQYIYLSNEKIKIVPREKPFTGPDRYLPYKKSVEGCDRVVEIFFPSEKGVMDKFLAEWNKKKWVEDVFEDNGCSAIIRKNL